MLGCWFIYRCRVGCLRSGARHEEDQGVRRCGVDKCGYALGSGASLESWSRFHDPEMSRATRATSLGDGKGAKSLLRTTNTHHQEQRRGNPQDQLRITSLDHRERSLNEWRPSFHEQISTNFHFTCRKTAVLLRPSPVTNTTDTDQEYSSSSSLPAASAKPRSLAVLPRRPLPLCPGAVADPLLPLRWSVRMTNSSASSSW